MANIAKLPLFCRCVIQNFPFIEEDFDALTNYELTCKIVEYLNKVIASQNEVINLSNELQIAFQQLHDYVENYFDNLDVQEEINNKLDDMVEQGTLQEIITTYIQANVEWTFDTVADMKLATNLVNGSYARTLGFHAVNDGGGAIYKISNTGTANERDIIAVGDLFANLVVLNSHVVAEQFGAYGDNTHNDTTVLQAFMTYCMTNGYTINCPKSYRISQALVIENTNKVTMNIKYLKYVGNDYAIKIIGSDYCNIHIDTLISNYDGISLEAHASGYKEVGYNVFYIGEAECSHNGIDFHCNDYGINYNTFTFNRIAAANNCINADCTDQTGWVSENTFNGGRLSGKGNNKCNICANLIKCQAQKFYHVGVEGCDYGFVIDSCKGIVLNYPRTAENPTYYVVQLKGNTGRTVVDDTTLYLNQIDWSQITDGYNNTFNGRFINTPSGGNPQVYTHFEIWGDGTMHNCDQKCLLYKDGRNSDMTMTLGSHNRGFPNLIYINKNTLTLDTKYYNAYNINEVWFYIENGTTADSLIKDSDGNTILDYSTYGGKTIKLTAISQNISGRSHYGWMIEDVTLE